DLPGETLAVKAGRLFEVLPLLGRRTSKDGLALHLPLVVGLPLEAEDPCHLLHSLVSLVEPRNSPHNRIRASALPAGESSGHHLPSDLVFHLQHEVGPAGWTS